MDRQIEEAINNRKGLTIEVKDYIKNEIEQSNKISEEKFEDLKSQIDNLVANPVPVGFIYVQLKDQPEPSKFWPGVGWTEVSSKYPGLFFRVTGGDAGEFGMVQDGLSPKLSMVQAFVEAVSGSTDIHCGSWSSVVKTGKNEPPYWGLSFFVNKTEVRPTNTAMKIWKRTS